MVRGWKVFPHLDPLHRPEVQGSYYIFLLSSYYYAKNLKTGIIDYGGPSDAGGISGTDARAIIQNVVNTVNTQGGGKIIFSPHDFNLDNYVDFTDKRKLILEGESFGRGHSPKAVSRFINNNSLTELFHFAGACYNITLKNLSFKSDGESNDTALNCIGNDFLIVEGCAFYDFYRGIKSTTGDCADWRLRDNMFIDIRYRDIDLASTHDRNILEGNTGLKRLYWGGAGTGSKIENNSFQTTYTDGDILIDLVNAQSMKISNNYIEIEGASTGTIIGIKVRTACRNVQIHADNYFNANNVNGFTAIVIDSGATGRFVGGLPRFTNWGAAAEVTCNSVDFGYKTLFIPPTGYNTGVRENLGRFDSIKLEDGVEDKVYSTFRVPSDFVSLVDLHPVILSAADGNIYWLIQSHYGASGESYLTHSGSMGWTATAVTTPLITELPDSSSILANLTKGDYIGIYFSRDASHADDTINNVVYFLGFLFEYIAEI